MCGNRLSRFFLVARGHLSIDGSHNLLRELSDAAALVPRPAAAIPEQPASARRAVLRDGAVCRDNAFSISEIRERSRSA